MASADTPEQRITAKSLGLRTFRVAQDNVLQAGEIKCPASAEAGRKTTCSDCKLCGGTSVKAKDIVIQDHAVGHAKRVIAIVAA